ncbi:MAG TPA: MerR family transcriptional regulator [Acidimicrobiales bacterium]|nr:MerR family transcriptional regulator [Acidimicrobiales bacterium]
MESTTQGYSGPQVCRLVGITYRQLDYWARTGLLTPTLATARGSGSKRRYDYTDVLELKVIKSLLDAGVSLQRARRAVDCLRGGLGQDLASSSLVLTEAGSVLAHSDGEIVDLLRGGQGVFNIVPLGAMVDDLAAEIVALGRVASGSATPPKTATA